MQQDIPDKALDDYIKKLIRDGEKSKEDAEKRRKAGVGGGAWALPAGDNQESPPKKDTG